jgi:CheY-like chemotaxis protein
MMHSSNCAPIESEVSKMNLQSEMKERAKAMLEHDFSGWESDRVIALVDAIRQEIFLKEDTTPEGTLPGMGSSTDHDDAADAEPMSEKMARLLIVDDDPFTFDLLEDTFEGIYEVLGANNGLAALDLAVKEKPDLILLDVMMPGMDGYDVCRHLKKDNQLSNIPVIFITGRGDLEAETAGLALGAVDYISKPLNLASVKARVANHVQLKRATDQLTTLAQLDRSLRDELLGALDFKWGISTM